VSKSTLNLEQLTLIVPEDHGIRFIAVTQGFETDIQNLASRFLLHVLGAAAEFADPGISEAEFLVTGDKEFPSLKQHKPTRIIAPAAMIELLKEGENKAAN